MRWLVLLLLLAPCAAAYDGWHYTGDTFTEDGIVYSVEGTGPDNVLLGIGGRLVFLALYECRQEGLTSYCYTESAYPSDSAHIKYAAGEQYFGYHISITTDAPSASVSREIDDTSLNLGQTATITVTVENDGDYTVRDLAYDEPIPAGLTLRSGPSSAGRIKWRLAALPSGEQQTFTYKLRADAFGTFTLKPTASYTYEGKSYNTTVGSASVDVDTPLTVTRNVTSTVNLDETGRYLVNFTNDDETYPIAVDAVLTPSAGIIVKNAKNFPKEGDAYATHATLDPGDTWFAWLDFTTSTGGTLTFPLAVEMRIDGNTINLNYTDTVSSTDDRITPSITLSSNKDAYYAGTELTISGVLENQNTKVKFSTIKGALTSPLFDDVTFAHESFPSSKKLTEASVRITLPDEAGTYPITFAGSYQSPSNRILEFSAKKDITVIARTHAVDVTRMVEPVHPAPGTNATITVTVKNAYGQYLTFDAHEKYPFVKTGGLSFAESSLERDASQQLYVYQLEIPADYTEPSFNISTVVKVKDEPLPEEFTTVVTIAGREQDVPQGTAPPAASEDGAAESEGDAQEELGFFASIWDFIKRLFA